MKYNFPYKLYFTFLIIFVIVAIYGFILIYDSTKSYFYLRIIYLLFVFALTQWYLDKYLIYKEQYIIVSDTSIILKSESEFRKIHKEEIDCIVIANHKILIKIFNVIHIYTLDNNHYYITNEINGFKNLKKILEYNFNELFYTVNKIIPNSISINKKELLRT